MAEPAGPERPECHHTWHEQWEGHRVRMGMVRTPDGIARYERCPVAPTPLALDPEEVRHWLVGSVDPGPRPVDDPQRLAERIRSLRVERDLRRVVADFETGRATPLDVAERVRGLVEGMDA